MSMILDPTRDGGLEVFYDNKLRNLVGTPENCADWVVEVSCEKLEWNSSKELYDNQRLFSYKGETWEQLTDMYLDMNGAGIVYADIFDRIGIEFKRLNVMRVDL